MGPRPALSDSPERSSSRGGTFVTARQVVYFVLGVTVIVDAVAHAGTNVAEMVVGLVLLGLVSADDLVTHAIGQWRRRNGNTAPPPKNTAPPLG